MSGRAANTFYIGPDIGMGLGPALGGVILATFGSHALFGMNAIFIVLALVLLLIFKRLGLIGKR